MTTSGVSGPDRVKGQMPFLLTGTTSGAQGGGVAVSGVSIITSGTAVVAVTGLVIGAGVPWPEDRDGLAVTSVSVRGLGAWAGAMSLGACAGALGPAGASVSSNQLAGRPGTASRSMCFSLTVATAGAA